MNTYIRICFILLIALPGHAQTISSEQYQLELTAIASGLSRPWSLALLPEGRMLVTEKPGRLRLWDNGVLSKPIAGVPAVISNGQGGMMEVILHPQFSRNQVIYLSYSKVSGGKSTTAVMRAKLDRAKLRLHEQRDIFVAHPAVRSGRHFGSRMLFDDSGLLYISVGDRGDDEQAQNADNHLGAIIRLRADGSIPPHNPFVSTKGKRAEIYSYGHRNPQGMILHSNGKIWIHEHGPRGGDEINVLIASANYGWPVITYGKTYIGGFSIGEGVAKPGLEQPLWHWTPSIAPSGMVEYRGDMFPKWRGNLLVGSLKFALLERLELQNNKVVHREQILQNTIGRVRDIREGSKGELYLLNDQPDGGIYLLTRKQS